MLTKLAFNSETKSFPKEIEEGNIEYKLRLDEKDSTKQRKMGSQMRWRVEEGKEMYGKNEAFYLIGINDDGTLGNISCDIIESSLEILKNIVIKCHLKIAYISRHEIDESHFAIVTITKIPYDVFIKENRIAFLGASKHGKSTCMSYLAYQQKDNGNGIGRSLIFRHVHEQTSGITSCIKHEIIGSKSGTIINYKSGNFMTWEKIVKNSDKIISMYDMPGSEKYVKTLLYGLMSYKPNYNLIFISPTDCITEENKLVIPDETLTAIELSINLNIPFAVLLSKSDIYTDETLALDTLKSIYLDSLSFEIYNKGKKYTTLTNIPVISISSVYGQGYDSLYSLLNELTVPENIVKKNSNITEFIINDVYRIPEAGCVVSGIMTSGEILVDGLYYVMLDNRFYPTKIRMIHKKQTESSSIVCPETGSLELVFSASECDITKHALIINETYMKLLSDSNDISNNISIVLSNPNKIPTVGHQYILFVDNIIEPILVTGTNESIIEAKFIKNNKFHIKNKSYCIIKGDFKGEFVAVGKILLDNVTTLSA
jgi:GTPase